jgi:hypothetical protein
MQDRFLGPRITLSDMERLRTLRHIKTLLQKELTKIKGKQGADPQDILYIRHRQKEVQKALDKLENHLYFIELNDQ